MSDVTKLSEEQLKTELEKVAVKIRVAKKAKKSEKKEERVKNLLAQREELLVEKRRRWAAQKPEEIS